MSIGSNIKTLRESEGLNQIEFGKIAGVSDKAVSTWENDIKIPRMGAIQKIADHFGIQKSDIIEGNINIKELLKKDILKEQILDCYEMLDEEGKTQLFDYVQYLKTKHNKK